MRPNETGLSLVFEAANGVDLPLGVWPIHGVRAAR